MADFYVCVCLAVRESEIRTAIRAGADTVAAVGGQCEAGSACHSCHPRIRELLREHAVEQLAANRAPESLHQPSLFDDLSTTRGTAPAGSHKPRST